jgi:hypothetical protein
MAAPAASINALWGSDANNVFAVQTSGAIIRWNGSVWSPMTSSTDKALNGVWGSSASDVYAVGGSGAVVHFDGNGTTWSPMISAASSTLYSVGGYAGGVFAVGNGGTAMHYEAGLWIKDPALTGHTLYSVWAGGL